MHLECKRAHPYNIASLLDKKIIKSRVTSRSQLSSRCLFWCCIGVALAQTMADGDDHHNENISEPMMRIADVESCVRNERQSKEEINEEMVPGNTLQVEQ